MCDEICDDKIPVLQIELPTPDGNSVEVMITEEIAAQLQEVFAVAWARHCDSDDPAVEKLVQAARSTRSSPYPERINLNTLIEYLRAAVKSMLRGSKDESATALAVLIDTLEHMQKPSSSSYRLQ